MSEQAELQIAGASEGEPLCWEPHSWRLLVSCLLRALLGLVVALSVTFWLGPEIIQMLRGPFYQAIEACPDLCGEITVSRVSDPFATYFRVCLLGALVLASPWISYQMWRFIKTGLGPRERRCANWGAVCSTVLFNFGAFFFLWVLAFPLILFHLRSGREFLGLPVFWLNFRRHITLMTTMMTVSGLIFQLSSVLYFMGRMGEVTAEQLRKCRRYVIVIALLVGAVVTSPSPVDQIGLAVVIWLFYEAGVLLVHLFGKGELERRAAEGSNGRGEYSSAE